MSKIVDFENFNEPLTSEEFLDSFIEKFNVSIRDLDPNADMILNRIDRQTLELIFASGQHYNISISRPFAENRQFTEARNKAIEELRKPAVAASEKQRRGPPPKPVYEAHVIPMPPAPRFKKKEKESST